MKLRTSLAILLLASSVACHPNGGVVIGNPPVIEDKVESYSVTQGQLFPDFFSAVLWPAQWTESDYEKYVKIINLDSEKLLDLMVTNERKPGGQINVLWRQFRLDLHCIENFHDDNSSGDPTTYSETDAVSFVALPPNDPQTANLAKCQDNVTARTQLHAQVDAFTAAESDAKNPGPIGKLNDEMNSILGTDNTLTVDTTKSRIDFSANSQGVITAKIMLGSFQMSDKKFSNETDRPDKESDPYHKIYDVSVSAAVDTLKFTILDIKTQTQFEKAQADEDLLEKANPKLPHKDLLMHLDSSDPTKWHCEKYPTAISYVFNMSRVKPLYSLNEYSDSDNSMTQTEEAEFKGDLTMMVGCDAKRTGSSQIVGKFSSPSVLLPQPTATPDPSATPPAPVASPKPAQSST